MTARTTVESVVADREVTLIRDFDFPRELVWRAWTESAAIARWFGPHGFETEVVANDLRVGGEFRALLVRLTAHACDRGAEQRC